MKINTVAVSVTSEDANILCLHERRGLIGYIFDVINKRSPDVTVQEISLFYHPVYCAKVELSFSRICDMNTRTVLDCVAMDGCLGSIQYIENVSLMQCFSCKIEDVPQESVSALQYDEKQAKELIFTFLKKNGFRKYRISPDDIKMLDLILLYRPAYACKCKKGERDFFRVIDGEAGERDYMLDIHYSKLKFCR